MHPVNGVFEQWYFLNMSPDNGMIESWLSKVLFRKSLVISSKRFCSIHEILTLLSCTGFSGTRRTWCWTADVRLITWPQFHDSWQTLFRYCILIWFIIKKKNMLTGFGLIRYNQKLRWGLVNRIRTIWPAWLSINSMRVTRPLRRALFLGIYLDCL